MPTLLLIHCGSEGTDEYSPGCNKPGGTVRRCTEHRRCDTIIEACRSFGALLWVCKIPRVDTRGYNLGLLRRLGYMECFRWGGAGNWLPVAGTQKELTKMAHASCCSATLAIPLAAGPGPPTVRSSFKTTCTKPRTTKHLRFQIPVNTLTTAMIFDARMPAPGPICWVTCPELKRCQSKSLS